MKPTPICSLAACALVAMSLPAAAQVKAAITKQVSPASPQELAIVELNTLSQSRILQFRSLTTPAGIVLKNVAPTVQCTGTNVISCRQYFSFGLDAQSKCNLTGDYVAKFDVVCLTDTQCQAGPHETAFSLKSENFCRATTVDVPAAKGWSKRWGNVQAKDVSVGAGNTLWYVNNDKLGLIQAASLDTNTGTGSMGTTAVRIDVGGQGDSEVWGVQADGSIVRRIRGGNWETKPGLAKDIGVGANGAVWCIGANSVAGGFGIHRWDASTNKWIPVAGGAVRIDVDPQGNPWVVNNAGDVFQWSNGGWNHKPGVKAVDVGIGANGSVFVVGTDGKAYKFGPNGWTDRGGSMLIAITVDRNGIPLALTESLDVVFGEP